MKQKIASLDDLKALNLVIIEDAVDVVDNFIMETLEKKGLSPSDLSRMTGINRQNINAVVKKKMKPGIDFALKVSFVLGKPVEEMFALDERAWVAAYKTDGDTTLYLDVTKLEIVDVATKRVQVRATGLEYFDVLSNTYLTRTERDSLLKGRIESSLLDKLQEIKEANPDLTSNQLNSTAIDEIKSAFDKDIVKIYQRLGQRLEPYAVP